MRFRDDWVGHGRVLWRKGLRAGDWPVRLTGALHQK